MTGSLLMYTSITGMTRVRLYIEDTPNMTSQSAQDQAGMKDEVIEALSRHPKVLPESVSDIAFQVHGQIGRVEEFLEAQSERFQDSQSTQLGPYYKAYLRRRSSSRH